MNILSIQSHVAYGHAGNASAVFPLQRMGFEVWPVHTVMFSNHTGHGSWRGPVFEPGTISEVIAGIEDRGVLKECTAVLSGYMGAPELGSAILDAVDKVKSENPEALYCCDPVIGDTDRGIFVRTGIPELFRDKVLQRADILTPNHFELEILTGHKVNTLEDALKAVKELQEIGPSKVLVTSLTRTDAQPGVIEMLAVDKNEAWIIATPRLEFPYPVNGSGDATTAVFLAKYLRTRNLKKTLEHTAGAIFALFEKTWATKSRELQLIAAQDAYVTPPQQFQASSVEIA